MRYLRKDYKFLRFEKSDRKTSKYQAILQNKKTGNLVKVHFGGIKKNGIPYEQYRDDNKEKILEQKKQYYIDNKDKILEQQKQKMTCDCGCIVNKGSITRHKKSKKHKKLMQSK